LHEIWFDRPIDAIKIRFSSHQSADPLFSHVKLRCSLCIARRKFAAIDIWRFGSLCPFDYMEWAAGSSKSAVAAISSAMGQAG
jgi:hypothetical protein